MGWIGSIVFKTIGLGSTLENAPLESLMIQSIYITTYGPKGSKLYIALLSWRFRIVVGPKRTNRKNPHSPLQMVCQVLCVGFITLFLSGWPFCFETPRILGLFLSCQPLFPAFGALYPILLLWWVKNASNWEINK